PTFRSSRTRPAAPTSLSPACTTRRSSPAPRRSRGPTAASSRLTSTAAARSSRRAACAPSTSRRPTAPTRATSRWARPARRCGSAAPSARTAAAPGYTPPAGDLWSPRPAAFGPLAPRPLVPSPRGLWSPRPAERGEGQGPDGALTSKDYWFSSFGGGTPPTGVWVSWGRMRGPTVMLALCVAGVMLPAIANAAASCAGDGPGGELQSGPEGGKEAQRATVLSDLQHTLAGQGIAACSGDAHPAAAALAMLNVDLSPEDKAKATVDIEVRDAVTHKRVRRDVDLSRIPDDGRAAAIAIEADELLRASWAEIALDTARARQAEARPQVVASVGQALAPAQVGDAGAVGARGVVEHYFGGAELTLAGGDAFGRMVAPRWQLEVAGELRAAPASTAPHGHVSALAAGGSLSFWVRVLGGRRASL